MWSDVRDINETISLEEGAHEIKVYAKNDKDKVADNVVHIGVKKPWDYKVAPTSPPPTATPILPSVTISP